MEIDSFNLTPKAKLALKDAKEFANQNGPKVKDKLW